MGFSEEDAAEFDTIETIEGIENALQKLGHQTERIGHLRPLMEKLLADGAIHEYEIDTEVVHTEAPGSFWIFYLAANAEGLDKARAALQASMKSNPLGGPAMGAMVDYSAHRDVLVRTDATYK